MKWDFRSTSVIVPKYEKEKVLVSWDPEPLTVARALKHPSVVPVLIRLDHGVNITLGETLAETLEENCRHETTREWLKNGN